MPIVIALAGGSLLFAVVIVLFVLGAAYTVYSKSGGGISAHPLGSDGDPGTGGQESGLHDPDHEQVERTFDEHGTR